MTTHLELYSIATQGVEEPERRLSHIAALETRLGEERAIAVQQMRQAGCSWAVVGRALGVSQQGAQQRFGHLDASPIEYRRHFGWLSIRDVLHKEG